MAFTESVKSFQVPATPGTSAWPPSLPSVPTSRATRVTSEANERSWSTIVLMASLSWRISPRTSTVIFFDKSPFATAIVTSAMLRTCAVRFDAMELTLSVRSFHTPVTSRTCAWPPSLPSVPTSRATRVTSDVNTPSCLIIVLTMVAERRNSPLSGRPSTSRCTVCRRSPLATAVMARVTSVVGHRRSSIRVLTEPSISAQAPVGMPKRTRCLVLPSLAHDFADALELLRHLLVGCDDLVERVGDLARDAVLVALHAYGEIAAAHGLQGVEQFEEIDLALDNRGGTIGAVLCSVGNAVAASCRWSFCGPGFLPQASSPPILRRKEKTPGATPGAKCRKIAHGIDLRRIRARKPALPSPIPPLQALSFAPWSR